MSKYLGENEYLVKNNKITITSDKKVKEKNQLLSNLESFIIQRPNDKYFIIVPREYIYFRNQDKYDESKVMKGIVKKGQRPVIFDKTIMLETASNMEKYLRFSKGYYFAKVYPKAIKDTDRASIEYFIDTDVRYHMRNKSYYGEDTTMVNLIQNMEEETLLKEGVPMDENIFDMENTRIVNRLHDLGYANFTSNFIEFAADSTGLENEMDIFVNILTPKEDSIHRRYTVGNIKVFTSYTGELDTSNRKTFIYDDIKYYYQDEMAVRTQTLNRTIDLEPGELYNQQSIENTYSGLNNIGTYRFINIVPSTSSEHDTVINYDVYLTPITQPWNVDGYLELFYSKSQNDLLGLSFTPSISNINLLGGGEKFVSSVEASIEFLVTGKVQNLRFKFDNSLSYPTLLDFYGKTLYRTGLSILNQRDRYNFLNNRTKTDMKISYDYNKQISQYIISNINASYSYTTKPSPKYTHYFTPVSMSYINSVADSSFLQDNPNPLFLKSIGKHLVTGVLAQNYNLLVSSPTFNSGFSYTANMRIEFSGIEVLALNKIFDPKNDWKVNLKNDSIGFAKYILADVNLTAEQRISEKRSVAGRLRFGMVRELDNAHVPYVKQFYVGGANSIRAWQIRELGPGGTKNPTGQGPYYQSGNVVLEGNLEYRFPLYGYFEGAIFMDAGNIWTLSSIESPEESKFKFNNFYNQIAVGAGLGIRFNFSFLVVRLDAGYKIREPYIDTIRNTYWADLSKPFKFLVSPNLNLAINYPF